MNLVFAPLLVPLATACLCALTAPAPRLQRALSASGALALLGTALVLLIATGEQEVIRAAAGDWPVPFGIGFAVDRLGAALIAVAAVMLVATLLWQWSDVDAAPANGSLHPLLHGLVAGCTAGFSTADLFNLYVWFELSLVCALGLLVQDGALRRLDATLRYFVLNVFGTLLLLAAVALLYAATGHLGFDALAAAAPGLPTGLLLPLLALLVVALLSKVAAFPLSAWLPGCYPSLPAPVLALFSALLTKLGLYAVIRTLLQVFAPAPEALLGVLGWVAVASMATGALGAVHQWDMRRILAFHSVSQVGYILLAIALASPGGTRAAIVFMLHHAIVKPGLFLVAALAMHATGHYDLRRIGGLYAARPALAVLFAVLALALVGIPPFSGFWGKYLIVSEALAAGRYAWAAAALLVGTLTLYSMVKIWLEAFWKPHPAEGWSPAAGARPAPALAACAALGAIALAAAATPETLIRFAGAAAGSLAGGAR